MSETARPGDETVLEVGPPVHGGHCIARLDGRIVFVRHAIEGEVVLARFTDTAKKGYWRADAVEIHQASPDRVASVWPAAGPGGVGGGELAHVALPAQRRWKARVIGDALRRIGGIERPVEVEAVPDDDALEGLGWRTRIELAVDAQGRAGMYRHRSHDIVPLLDMPLAVPAIAQLGLFERRWTPGARIDAVAPAGGDEPLVLVDGEPVRGPRRHVRESVVAAGQEFTYRVQGAGFWQVHAGAPAVLVEAVLAAADVHPGGHVLELYSGAGLLTLPLAAAVGAQGLLEAVEGDPDAVRDARRNAHGLAQVVLHSGDVADVLARPADALRAAQPGGVVVLDPARSGAGPGVLAAICARAPERIVYVACDPASLARDLRAAAEHGYGLADLRAFDLFPHTHHIECVALLRRA